MSLSLVHTAPPRSAGPHRLFHIKCWCYGTAGQRGTKWKRDFSLPYIVTFDWITFVWRGKHETENIKLLISLKIHFSIFVKALLMFHNYATNLTLTVIIITNNKWSVRLQSVKDSYGHNSHLENNHAYIHNAICIWQMPFSQTHVLYYKGWYNVVWKISYISPAWSWTSLLKKMLHYMSFQWCRGSSGLSMMDNHLSVTSPPPQSQVSTDSAFTISLSP